ncbi:MAG: hypothetical protein KIT31_09010 [Deltaproteobacteria bacterium]|nr:hypothetical protein [Deltaproteobacteria bacterium]
MELRGTREVLLNRYGLVFFDDLSEGVELPASHEQAIELELARLGYIPSARLAARLRRLPVDTLAEVQAWMRDTLLLSAGGGQKHEPLFRKFPDDIPADTYALWVQKVLVHFIQGEDQPCLFCRDTGTTHVLSPCQHVVCDRCFDGGNYAACPICEHAVDRSSPFFEPLPERTAGVEKIRFKLLDVGDSLDASTRTLLAGLCARLQAMSPDDVAALTTVVGELRERALPWLPEVIPVRENVAHVFGTLFRACDPAQVLTVAAPYLKTATDVLRLIAALSGADPSLQFGPVETEIAPDADLRRWHGKFAQRIARAHGRKKPFAAKHRAHRFRVAKLARPLRRALLGALDRLNPDALAEDMLRHRSTWEGVGETLHPHEYATRFPNAARAFQIVRGKDDDGRPAPVFKTYYARLVGAMTARDVDGMLALLEQRPGELARRYDHALRIAGDDAAAGQKVMAAFARHVGAYATPVLFTLRSLLPARRNPGPMRVYWPKGETTTGVSMPETRAPLRADVVADACRAIDDELLRRLAELPPFDDAILDDALRDVIVPFNERTASRSMISLPRGSRVTFDADETRKTVRLFLHWCEPQQGGTRTDIDLSVGFYDAAWTHTGTCSWSQLQYPPVAKSAGDLRSAPFPDGATEYIDVDRAAARAKGIRYCVMVVANYSGMSFDKLDRGFAGLMLRDDTQGLHFDPRTVQLRFDLAGENGVYLPLVLDLETNTMHWLDVYAKGMFAFNTVEASNASITTVCPTLIAYFASGARPSVFELAALHAAARARRVFVRGRDGTIRVHARGDASAPAFLRRLLERDGGDVSRDPLPSATPALAALYRGDLELAAGGACYALYRERALDGVTPIAASDLLTTG